MAIPCEGKVPLVKWKPWQSEMPPLETQMEWFMDTRVNVAIITTGMVLFDVDDPALVDLVLGHCGPTPHVVHTPRGGTHLGYRARSGVQVGNQVRIKGRPIDIRTNGGIEVIPPSVTELGAVRGAPRGAPPGGRVAGGENRLDADAGEEARPDPGRGALRRRPPPLPRQAVRGQFRPPRGRGPRRPHEPLRRRPQDRGVRGAGSAATTSTPGSCCSTTTRRNATRRGT